MEQAKADARDTAAEPGEPTPVHRAVGPPAAGVGHQGLVPDWLVNLAELGWRVLAIAGLVVVLWIAGTILWTVTASMAVAIIVSAVLAPYVLRLRARGRSRTAAAGMVWAAALLVVAGVLLLLALAFLPFVVELVSWVAAGLEELDARLAELQIPAWVANLASDAFAAVRSGAGDAQGGIVAAAAGAVTVAILASFLVFFFLRDGDKAWLWMFQAVSDQKRDLITTAGDTALARVGGYLRGTTVLAAIIAVTSYAFMVVLDVPLALPLAVLSFLSAYIPYFGGIVTTALILMITLASQGAGATLAMLALMGIRSAMLGYLVRPAVYGRTVKIHPALVLIVLPAGYELAGIVGLFAAVPVTAVILAVASATVAILDPDPPPRLPALVPAWLDRVAQFSWRTLVVIALGALLVGVLVTVPLVVVPLILATIIAATLEPLVLALIRRGRTRARASAIAVGGGFLTIAAVLILALGALVQHAGDIAATTTSGAAAVDDATGGHMRLPAAAIADGASAAVRAVAAMADEAATLVAITVLSTLLAFYLLRDGGRLWGRAVSRLSSTSGAEVGAAGARAFEVLGGYMIGTAAISFVGAASQLVIMVVLGLPLALPVFVLSFILGFIPYIGGFISTGIAFLITIAVGSPSDVLIMAIWTIVFNIVTGNIVSPLVYGRTVHIHPAIVLVAIPAGAAIAGILGMFIVVPVIGVVATTWRTVLGVMGTREESDVQGRPPSEPSVEAHPGLDAAPEPT
jgi:predicted PurR-regulated permease PerM